MAHASLVPALGKWRPGRRGVKGQLRLHCERPVWASQDPRGMQVKGNKATAASTPTPACLLLLQSFQLHVSWARAAACDRDSGSKVFHV